jgi:hypothetical protein
MDSGRLSPPTPDTVIDACVRFDADDRYGPADRILSVAFSDHPRNVLFDDVLLKVALLNSLYNTNIFAFWAMALHIHGLNIDPSLEDCDPTLVSRIAPLTIRGKTRRHYSFATKYCSWRRPDAYPIYDRLVERAILIFRDQYAFTEFNRSDLKEYPRYKAILTSFRKHFGLEQLTFKQVDKFLWFTSKDLELGS